MNFVPDNAFAVMARELEAEDSLPAVLQELQDLEREYNLPEPLALPPRVPATPKPVLPSIRHPRYRSATSGGSTHKAFEPLRELSDSLLRRGLMDGLYSDLEVEVLGMTYALHRIVLLHNAYFGCLLEGPWNESGKRRIVINVSDPNVTVEGVTLCLSRIYGETTARLTTANAKSVLAASLFFGDMALCQDAVDFIAGDISPTTVLDYLLFVDGFWYGVNSTIILEECLTFLCREGYSLRELQPAFQGMPANWLARIVSSDCFWVPGEEQRWQFIRDVLQRRRFTTTTAADPPRKLAWMVGSMADMSLETQRIAGRSRGPSELCKETQDTVSSSSSSETLCDDDAVSSSDEKDDLAFILEQAVAYENVSFDALLRIRSEVEDVENPAPSFGGMLERAAWTQMKLRSILAASSRETLLLGIDEPAIPRVDTRNIDGYCLSSVLAETKVLSHDGSSFPPFRFGVEFHDLVAVATRDKVYSQKVFYAGSMWQVYLQNVAKEKLLGVYLRRVAVPTIRSGDHTRLAPENPYVDPRKTTTTWFRIFCFFGEGECTLLESRPDKFEIEQSWGWKINKLHRSAFSSGKSLKCSVVLGHV
ncbi:hypothetical protein HKX48_006030 [Thoreauomyces humboldtii]|nr:hypothetical protein HKX48_006030 [Thoreauomyces humboldtii]